MTMSATLWPIPIGIALYYAGYYIGNGLMAVGKAGSLPHDVQLWYWIIIALAYFVLQILEKMITYNANN